MYFQVADGNRSKTWLPRETVDTIHFPHDVPLPHIQLTTIWRDRKAVRANFSSANSIGKVGG
jgi:hypothetical protein